MYVTYPYPVHLLSRCYLRDQLYTLDVKTIDTSPAALCTTVIPVDNNDTAAAAAAAAVVPHTSTCKSTCWLGLDTEGKEMLGFTRVRYFEVENK